MLFGPILPYKDLSNQQFHNKRCCDVTNNTARIKAMIQNPRIPAGKQQTRQHKGKAQLIQIKGKTVVSAVFNLLVLSCSTMFCLHICGSENPFVTESDFNQSLKIFGSALVVTEMLTIFIRNAGET